MSESCAVATEAKARAAAATKVFMLIEMIAVLFVASGGIRCVKCWYRGLSVQTTVDGGELLLLGRARRTLSIELGPLENQVSPGALPSASHAAALQPSMLSERLECSHSAAALWGWEAMPVRLGSAPA